MRINMKKIIFCLLLLVTAQFGFISNKGSVYAQAKADSVQHDSIPEPEQSITHHSVEIGGEEIEYTATAGTMIVYNDLREPIASFGYTAYTKEGVEDSSQRPVLFAYNGGPGSASIWLHMGALGPRRVEVNDPEMTPPAPYQLVDNHFSILDVTDIVMIDPVGTGYSRAVGEKENSYFWGLDTDISSISRFIREYIETNSRWNSPKYILGESYGTTRSAGIVNHMLSNGITLNGVVLVSSVLDLRTIAYGADDSLPYVLYLPTFAATAWYHNEINSKPENLQVFLEEVREFAITEYAPALLKGDDLSETRRDEIVNQLSNYTGLSEDYLNRADMRVTGPEFAKRLLYEQERVVGRFDARYMGYSINALANEPFYDAQSASISAAYMTMFLKYYQEELEFGEDRQYMFSAGSLPGFDWDWSLGGGWPTSPNTAPELAEAMIKNPNLKVLVLNGYYDLATPFMATEYTMNHLGLPAELEDNIIMEYYKAGHMMYIRESALKKMHDDVAQFIEQTDRIN